MAYGPATVILVNGHSPPPEPARLDHAVHIADARGMIQAAMLRLDEVLADTAGPIPDDDLEILAATAFVVRSMRSRSKGDLLRWYRDVKAGKEGWLIVHSLKGERRVDVKRLETLKSHVRRAIWD